MARSVVEIFITELGRAGSKTADRFLSARKLQKADRDDVVAAAVLWCWSHRDSYSLTTTLETWFMNAVRDAYKDLKRNELPTSSESIEKLGGSDDTYNTAAAASSADVLINALTSVDKTVALMTMQGYTQGEIMEKGISHSAVQGARARIKQLRRLVTDVDGIELIQRASRSPSSDDASDHLSGLDAELEQLDFAPPSGKDCPPCWRCMWFEGYMPDGKRSTRLEIVDKEVSDAVQSTEARKIEIAQMVRDQAL